MSVDQGVGVLLFTVENPHDEPAYLDVDFSEAPTVESSLKRWEQGVMPDGDPWHADVNCTKNPNHALCNIPKGDVGTARDFAVPNLLGGVRAWDATTGAPTQLPPCQGCRQGAKVARFLVQPRVSGSQPRVVRVMVVATDLSPFYPGRDPNRTFEEVSIGNVDLTGAQFDAFVGCARFQPKGDGNYCVSQVFYWTYVALTRVELALGRMRTPVRSSATSTAMAFRVEGTLEATTSAKTSWVAVEDEI